MANCWMCDDRRFRSVCPTHPTGIRPLADPQPRLRIYGPERN